jgi:hypothetical protein
VSHSKPQRRDLVADQVVNAFLKGELSEGLRETDLDEDRAYRVIALLEYYVQLEAECSTQSRPERKWDIEDMWANIGRMLAPLRLNPRYREGLSAYHGEGSTAGPRRCLGCTRELEVPEPGKSGPRRKTCSNRCRQYVYRLLKQFREAL